MQPPHKYFPTAPISPKLPQFVLKLAKYCYNTPANIDLVLIIPKQRSLTNSIDLRHIHQLPILLHIALLSSVVPQYLA